MAVYGSYIWPNLLFFITFGQIKDAVMTDIIGRDAEFRTLNKVSSSRKSEFVAVYGRRRVGKTFLIREFFQYEFDFQLTGLANATTKQQLTNFHASLQRQSSSASDSIPPNWFEAFQRLITYLEQIEAARKKVVFLDELPWLDTKRSDFMIALEHFWNSWASNRKDIILITCGSAASWMINELINNHGGLHNRVTERIKVYPFTLKESEQLLKSKKNVLDRYQILQLYMVMGGIPFYLDAVSPEKSAAQNIEDLCFREGGLLTREYQNLFASLFKNASKHEAIIASLATKTKGMTRNELIRNTGMKTGGSISRRLDELEESGFISRYTHFNRKSKTTLYRLSDFYSFFYHKFIKSHQSIGDGTWLNAIDSPRQRAWAGFAFEQICLAHVPQIKKALGISGVLTHAVSWRSKSLEDGAQVDLIIDRRDQVINLFELKYSINPYVIDKSYADRLRKKIAIFKSETKTRKAIFLTFITTFGLVQNTHAASLVQQAISMDALFE